MRLLAGRACSAAMTHYASHAVAGPGGFATCRRLRSLNGMQSPPRRRPAPDPPGRPPGLAPRRRRKQAVGSPSADPGSGRMLALRPAPPVLGALASGGALISLGLFFLETGALVFSSGLAIVPLLRDGVVAQHHWLTQASSPAPSRWASSPPGRSSSPPRSSGTSPAAPPGHWSPPSRSSPRSTSAWPSPAAGLSAAATTPDQGVRHRRHRGRGRCPVRGRRRPDPPGRHRPGHRRHRRGHPRPAAAVPENPRTLDRGRRRRLGILLH
jgi:hypothetical protein